MGKRCPYCRTIIEDNSMFCPECGKEYPKGKTCSFCGAAISDDDVFCQNCGVVVSKGKACPHCRAALNEGDMFCQNCGAKIEKEEETPQSSNTKDTSPNKQVKAEIKQDIPKAVVTPQVKPIEPSTSEKVIEDVEQPNDHSEGTSKSKIGKYVIISLIALALIGGGVFFFLSRLNGTSNNWESKGEILTSVPTGSKTLYGTIGEHAITMELNFEASNVDGSLYYNKYGPSNKLFVSGSLHNNEIELKEHNMDGMETGRYSGKYLNGSIQGKYTNYKGDVYSFYLSETEGEPLQSTEIAEENNDVEMPTIQMISKFFDDLENGKSNALIDYGFTLVDKQAKMKEFEDYDEVIKEVYSLNYKDDGHMKITYVYAKNYGNPSMTIECDDKSWDELKRVAENYLKPYGNYYFILNERRESFIGFYQNGTITITLEDSISW